MKELDNYAVFKKFWNIDLAKDIVDVLKQNDISFKLLDNSPAVDISFSGNTFQKELEIHIRQSDFERANELLEKHAEMFLDQVDKGHYLFDFTNEELYEILCKPDEWNSFDYKLSQKILANRGLVVNDELIKALRNTRMDDLAKPENGQKPWIFIGYLFAILGGILGLFIGWYLWTYQKTLPDGQKVYAYSKSDQIHGRIIFFVGLGSFVFWVLVRFNM